MGGIMSITGYPGQPPARVGMSIGDIGAGLYTAIAVNAALLHRLRDRRGDQDRYRACSIASWRCSRTRSMRYTVEGEIPGPLGARHPTITPFQAFRPRTATSSSPPAMTGCSCKLCDGARHAGHGTRARLSRRMRCARRISRSCRRDRGHPRRQDDRGMDRDHRGGRRAVRPDQQCRAGLAHPQVDARNMLVTIPDGERRHAQGSPAIR